MAVVIRLMGRGASTMGRGWYALAAALAVALSSCSETNVMHGDVTFTTDERAAIEEGNVFVSERLGRTPLVIVWDGEHDDSLCPEFTIQRRALGDGGVSNQHERCIVLGALSARRFQVALAAHEIGHWHGMGHVTHGLMQPKDMPLEWSEEDQAECESKTICR